MKRLSFYLFLALLFASCAKEINEPKANYIPMKIGNYWVYENYQINEDGSETNLLKTDSVIISRDTVINGNKYFVFEGTNYPTQQNWSILQIVRDSTGYLVRDDGRILFSESNFSSILYSGFEIANNGDTICSYTCKMVKPLEPIALSIGTFDVLNSLYIVATDYDIPGYPREFPRYYVNNIGKALSTSGFFISPIRFEQRLIRYNIIN